MYIVYYTITHYTEYGEYEGFKVDNEFIHDMDEFIKWFNSHKKIMYRDGGFDVINVDKVTDMNEDIDRIINLFSKEPK